MSYYNDKIFFFGGFHADTNRIEFCGTAACNTSKDTDNTPANWNSQALVNLLDGIMYLVGGVEGNAHLDSVHIYNAQYDELTLSNQALPRPLQ